MNEEKKPYVSPPPEADGNYAYYCVHDFIPVRCTLTKAGFRGMKEAPSLEQRGKLEISVFSSAFEKDDDVEKITKEEFIRLVYDFLPNRQMRMPRSSNIESKKTGIPDTK